MAKIANSDCWVIIPAHNEQSHIASVVKKVKTQGFKTVVVDDGSKDTTSKLAENAGAIVLRHMINFGKGAAMKTGCDYAVEHGAKALIMIDADGQHKPEELPLFVKELNKGYDVVFGYRRLTSNTPWIRRLGGIFINIVVRIFYNVRLHDSLCGYRAFTANAYKLIRWRSRDYAVESEIIARAGLQYKKIRYSQFPISTIYHDKYKGVTVLDGIPVVWRLIWWRITI